LCGANSHSVEDSFDAIFKGTIIRYTNQLY